MNKVSEIFNKFLVQQKKHPNKTAIYYLDNNITYSELLNNIAEYTDLICSLCSANGPVILHMERTPRLVAAMFACIKLGRPYIPLDPAHPLERKLSILNDFDVHISAIPEILPLKTQLSDNTAYVLFTSGTTGKSKGIEINSEGVINLIHWSNQYYSAIQLECVLASTTVCFDLSIFEIFVPLCLGHSIFLVDSILELINIKPQYSKITLVNTVPSAMRAVVDADCIPPNVNTVNLAGEVLYWNLVEKLYQKSSINNIYNLWGPSEDTTYSSVYKCPKYHSSTPTTSVPIGKAIKGTTIHLVENELWLSGPCLASGYYKRNDLNATKFVIKNGIRYFRTGDVAEIDNNGDLVFKGRLDFQVKIRGFRIELEEIENHILSIESVIEVGAVSINIDEHTKIAVVVYNKGESIEELKKQLKHKIPSYMMPHYWFTTNTALPKTANGKLCRQTIKKTVLENSLLTYDNFGQIDTLTHLVSAILKFSVDPNLSLVSQGVDSLSAVKIFTECNKRWENNLTLANLLTQNSTISELEKLVDTTKVIDNSCNFITLRNDEIHYEEARMYNTYISSENTSSYNIAIRFDIRGKDIDLVRLKTSCKYIVSRNKIFHYNYTTQNGKLQKIYNHQEVFIENHVGHDFQNLAFDLTKDLLVRIAVCDDGKHHCSLYFCFPHVAIDGIGIDNLMNQISRHYAGEYVNTEYAIFLDTGYVADSVLNFWRDELAQYREQVFTWPNNNYLDSKSYNYAFEIDYKHRNKLSTFANKLDLSLPTLLLGIFYILLYRMGFGEKLVVGCPTANRCSPTRENIICNFINTLPIGVTVNGGDTLVQFLLHLKVKFLRSLSLQNISIDRVLSKLVDKNDNNAFNHLFDIIFSYLNIGNTFKIQNTSIKSHLMFPKHAKAPLVLSAIDGNDKMQIFFECQGAKIDKQYLEAFGETFRCLLLELSVLKNCKIDDINILPKKHLKMIQANVDYIDISCQDDIVQTFLNIAKKYPDKTAVIDGGQKITYNFLYLEAVKIAYGIQSKNVPSNSAVGISMTKGWRIVSTILGILFQGCYYVPLEPRNPILRNQYITDHSNIKLVITEKEYQEFTTMCRDNTGFCYDKNYLDNLAYVMYTSGTTGRPKGVSITHRNVVRLFKACEKWAKLSHKDNWTFFHSYAFDFSVWEIFGAILYGGTLVVIQDSVSTDFIEVAKTISDHKISILSQTPTAFKNLLSITDIQYSHVPRMVIFGGEELKPEIINPWWNKYGENTTMFVNMYGITETTVHSTFKSINRNISQSNIGVPLLDVGMVIVDQNENLVPIGIPGEVWISGHGLCKEYVNDHYLNKKRFVVKNFKELNSKYDRFYKTGDLAVLNVDGDFEYLGRIDKQIKINGYRVEIAEITKAINQFFGIQDSYVKVLESENNIKILVAYYKSLSEISHSELKAFLETKLPFYAIPEFFQKISMFPLTVNGKIDEAKLPEINIQKEQHLTPIDATNCRHIVKKAWSQVLNTQEFQDSDNFFSLGGNSIKAVILAQKLNMSVVDIFRYTTFTQQVNILETNNSKERAKVW